MYYLVDFQGSGIGQPPRPHDGISGPLAPLPTHPLDPLAAPLAVSSTPVPLIPEIPCPLSAGFPTPMSGVFLVSPCGDYSGGGYPTAAAPRLVTFQPPQTQIQTPLEPTPLFYPPTTQVFPASVARVPPPVQVPLVPRNCFPPLSVVNMNMNPNLLSEHQRRMLGWRSCGGASGGGGLGRGRGIAPPLPSFPSLVSPASEFEGRAVVLPPMNPQRQFRTTQTPPPPPLLILGQQQQQRRRQRQQQRPRLPRRHEDEEDDRMDVDEEEESTTPTIQRTAPPQHHENDSRSSGCAVLRRPRSPVKVLESFRTLNIAKVIGSQIVLENMHDGSSILEISHPWIEQIEATGGTLIAARNWPSAILAIRANPGVLAVFVTFRVFCLGKLRKKSAEFERFRRELPVRPAEGGSTFCGNFLTLAWGGNILFGKKRTRRHIPVAKEPATISVCYRLANFNPRVEMGPNDTRRIQNGIFRLVVTLTAVRKHLATPGRNLDPTPAPAAEVESYQCQTSYLLKKDNNAKKSDGRERIRSFESIPLRARHFSNGVVSLEQNS